MNSLHNEQEWCEAMQLLEQEPENDSYLDDEDSIAYHWDGPL
jgi:hypothetical protein